MSKFDSEIWKAQAGIDQDSENPRSGMVSTLIDEVLKPGMARNEVEKLLGVADYVQDGDGWYVLGRSPYGVDYEYFVVHYKDDKVDFARLERG